MSTPSQARQAEQQKAVAVNLNSDIISLQQQLKASAERQAGTDANLEASQRRIAVLESVALHAQQALRRSNEVWSTQFHECHAAAQTTAKVKPHIFSHAWLLTIFLVVLSSMTRITMP